MTKKPKANITGRDDLIIAQALYEAAYVLRDRQPEYLEQPSNADDMEKLLYTRYPQLAAVYTSIHLKQRALALGYEPHQGPVDDEELIEFILAKDPGATFVGRP